MMNVMYSTPPSQMLSCDERASRFLKIVLMMSCRSMLVQLPIISLPPLGPCGNCLLNLLGVAHVNQDRCLSGLDWRIVHKAGIIGCRHFCLHLRFGDMGQAPVVGGERKQADCVLGRGESVDP